MSEYEASVRMIQDTTIRPEPGSPLPVNTIQTVLVNDEDDDIFYSVKQTQNVAVKRENVAKINTVSLTNVGFSYLSIFIV